MKFRIRLLLVLPVLMTASEPATKPAPIREFDAATLSRLGREIYLHDQLAWKATDVVMAQVGLERLQKDGGRGWIVDTSETNSPIVRFLRSGADGLESLCDIAFQPGKNPELIVPQNRALTKAQVVQAVALETAKARFDQGDLAWCGGNPNTVVLTDPDGSGFLVYFLRAKPTMDQVPIGGHYRFTVSAGGKKVERVDRLFASCLTLPKQSPNGGKTEFLVMSHVISPTPIETHVFLSLQEGVPFLVTTTNGMAWGIEKGEITKMGTLDELIKKQPSGSPKPAKSKNK
jgi:hypothetical protein